MSNYEDLKKKAKDAIDTIADISVEAYKIAEEKARILARRTKLSAEITRERVAIRRLKTEIGDKYYELHKDYPEEALKQSCEDITSSLDTIAAKKRELDELKNIVIINENDENDEKSESQGETHNDSDQQNWQ